MKKSLLLFCCVVIAGWTNMQAAISWSGSGTPESPYLIPDAEHLDSIRSFLGNANANLHFALTADIDLKGYTEDWKPIGEAAIAFYGKFHGNGHVIKNLKITKTNGECVGLFGQTAVGSTIDSLGLVNCNITGKTFVGSLVGLNNSTINHCYASGSVKGNATSSYVGGLAGLSWGNITNAYTMVNVSGFTYVGGAVGAGNAIPADPVVAFKNVYVSGLVTGTTTTTTGAFIGHHVAGKTTYKDCFYDNQVCQLTTASGNSKTISSINSNTTANMYKKATFNSLWVLWNFVTDWNIWDGSSYPYFIWQAVPAKVSVASVQETSGICNPTNFSKLEVTDVNGILLGTTTTLSANNAWTLALTGVNLGDVIYVTSYETGKSASYPIPVKVAFTEGTGSESNPFTISTAEELNTIRNYPGTENNGYYFRLKANIDLSGFASWAPVGTNTVPFYGHVDGGGYVISNLNIDLPAAYYVGLFGYLGKTSSIENLHITNASVTGSSNIGILVGYNYGEIKDCSASGTANAVSGFLGGLVGYNYGLISGCHASASLSGKNYMGGLVGNNAVSGSKGTISNSYASGIINGTVSYNGGFIGNNASNNPIVLNCYSASMVSLGSSGAQTGSFIGLNNSEWVGYYNDTQMPCYVNADLCTLEPIGDNRVTDFDVYKKTTQELKLKSTFNNWDFTTIWTNWEGKSAPFFAWQSTPLSIEHASSSSISGTFLVQGGVTLDSVKVLDTQFRLVEKITTFGTGTWSYTPTNIEPGDTLLFISYESGKKPSPIQIVIQPWKGEGTVGAPFEITTGRDLDNVRNYLGETHADKYFILKNDIDLGSYTTNWTPLGTESNAFCGNFNGDGHVILNMKSNQGEGKNVGLFGYTGVTALVQKLGIVDCDIIGKQYVGAIAGNNYGKIDACFSQGKVSGITGTSSHIGGIAGYNNNEISNCYSQSKVYGETKVGGIVGSGSATSKISKTYAAGPVSGGNTDVAAFAGENYATSTSFVKCYFDNETALMTKGIGSSTSATGLMGLTTASLYTDNYNFTDWKVAGSPWKFRNGKSYPYLDWQSTATLLEIATIQGISGNCEPTGFSKLEIYRKNGSLFRTITTLGENGSWSYNMAGQGITLNDTLYVKVYEVDKAVSYTTSIPVMFDSGTGIAADPFIITTAKSLNFVRKYPGTSAATGSHFRLKANIDMASWGNWKPVSTTNFFGQFKGGNYTISNLMVDGTIGATAVNNAAYQSLFGKVGAGALIDSLSLVNVAISGTNYLGGIASTNSGTITACYVSGNINGVLIAGAGANNIGGITGQNAGSLFSCCASVNIYGSSNLGAIVGQNNQSVPASQIKNCYASGSVYPNTAALLTNKTGIGGFVGNNAMNASILGTYTLAHVISGAEATSGAFVGENFRGYIGKNAIEELPCFFNSARSGLTDGVKKHTDNATPYPVMVSDKLMESLKSEATYTNWDFTNTWRIWEGKTTPYLVWQSAPVAIENSTLLQLSGSCYQQAGITVDSVLVLNKNLQRVTKLSVSGNSWSFAPGAGFSVGDTVYLVSFERGKAPSAATFAVLERNTDMAVVSANKMQHLVYPGMAVDFIYVNGKDIEGNMDVTIYNITGTLVSKQTKLQGGMEHPVAIGNLSAGTYIVNVKSVQGEAIAKFVKK